MPLAERLTHVQWAIADRPPQCLLAASKGVAAKTLRRAYALGLRHFGENYLQEALDKQMALSDLDGIVWHFIGRIQRNKTAALARNFDWVESVDRPLIAERLNTARAGMAAPLNVLIEVAVSAEDSKGGCAPEEVPELAIAISRLSHLRLRGLMALVHPQAEQADADFRRMAELFFALQQTPVHADLDTLSMGTSADYLQALQHSATEIRLGTILFGARTQESL
ncbi:YggS family pyridoxal phosphate enzyme [Acidithiobacillus ferrivorans]|uniref:YggS family pyridoxal phosphate-dependent enzyme n=1 Tax=Acidithiobacillus ferrivorans TaxID=160808 RepID=UPI000892E8A0|nr:YggS family pyridoxal phosphate-dependent enzyme [Acidithiobacillus ferrivorans]MBU2768082.1 YggS family pyridoxal phosphate-dependent enzyme [Acidithiobacillus ferrivorans]OFA17739.1 YggS family pyridoxal phosphate enzyme [Acidithiobacillus ferrivorans]